MRTYFRLLLVLSALAFAPTAVRAGPILSVAAPGTDLNNLTVGQMITFEVSLGGLVAGDALGFLAATLSYDDTLLSAPVIAAGAIVPDTSGFLSSSFPGTADAAYDALLAATGLPITSNGIFFTFEVSVLQAGAGTISFSFVDSQGEDSNGAPLPPTTTGGSLRFGAPTAVPEPSSLLLALAALALPGCRATLRLIRPGRARQLAAEERGGSER